MKWPQFTEVHLPMWLLVLIAGGTGMACAPPSRFSLRGLFSATTIVAIVLGLGFSARMWPEPEPIAVIGGARVLDVHE